MSNYRDNSPYLTPTYQNVLMKTLMDTVLSRNAGNVNAYWECLNSLYIIAAPEVLEEIEKPIQDILAVYKNISSTGSGFGNIQEKFYYATYNFRRQNADRIFTIIMKSLHKHNYCKQEFGAKPLNRNVPHIGAK